MKCVQCDEIMEEVIDFSRMKKEDSRQDPVNPDMWITTTSYECHSCGYVVEYDDSCEYEEWLKYVESMGEDEYGLHENHRSDLSEIALTEDGEILWEEPYKFKRLFAKGQSMIVKGITYEVKSCKLIGDVVHTVLAKERPMAEQIRDMCRCGD